tara:strand:+ start:59 stop:616 length:558 start_codon:yes stop_codon:yes gene_type:complete
MNDIAESQQGELKDLIPLWLAVGLTVIVAVPFGLWLGKYNFALWCAFIVWAQYFVLGAKPAAIKIIIPSFCSAAFIIAASLWLASFLSFLPSLVTDGDLALTVGLSLGSCFAVYSMRWAKVFEEGSLPFFNGISMVLAIYFTGSYPDFGGILPAPFGAAIWASVMCVFGCFLGFFNIWVMFSKKA